MFLPYKSMPFIAQKHVSYRIKAMLLSDKSIALINREQCSFHSILRKRLTTNDLQTLLILGDFRTKIEIPDDEGQNDPRLLSDSGAFRLKVVGREPASLPSGNRGGKKCKRFRFYHFSPFKFVFSSFY